VFFFKHVFIISRLFGVVLSLFVVDLHVLVVIFVVVFLGAIVVFVHIFRASIPKCCGCYCMVESKLLVQADIEPIRSIGPGPMLAGPCWCDMSWTDASCLRAHWSVVTDRLVVKSLSASAIYFPQQRLNEEPLPSFFASTLGRSGELCLSISIFSLYLQCSSYSDTLSLCFPSSVSSCLAIPLSYAGTSFTRSLFRRAPHLLVFSFKPPSPSSTIESDGAIQRIEH